MLALEWRKTRRMANKRSDSRSGNIPGQAGREESRHNLTYTRTSLTKRQRNSVSGAYSLAGNKHQGSRRSQRSSSVRQQHWNRSSNRKRCLVTWEQTESVVHNKR